MLMAADTYKRKILAEYDAATESGAKGALLRRKGLYSSSSITQWRQARAVGSEGLERICGLKADPSAAEATR